MAKQYYVATVQIVIKADSEGQACDAFSGMLSEQAEEMGVLDWSYRAIKNGKKTLLLSGEHASPVPIELPENYEEGDFLSCLPESHK